MELLGNKSKLVTLIIGYNRPDFIRERLQNALDSNIENLVVSIDFYNQETTRLMREIFQEFQEKWPSDRKIWAIFHTENQGLTRHVTGSISNLLVNFEEIIVIEDDIRFSYSTIISLKYGLNLMKSNSRIASVGCYSGIPMPKRLQIFNGYRISPYFACWGWATTRSVWLHYSSEIDKNENSYNFFNSETWQSLNQNKRLTWLGRFNKISSHPDHTWDTQFQYMCFRFNFYNILPVFPIIENVGFDDPRGVHTSNTKPRWMIADNITGKPISTFLTNRVILKVINELESLTLFGDNQRTIQIINSILKKIHFR